MNFLKEIKYNLKSKLIDKLTHINLKYETYILNGNKKEYLRKDICKSFTANFLQILYTGFAYNDANFTNSGAPFNSKTQAMNEANSLYDVSTLSLNTTFRASVPANVDNFGIVLSTSTTAPTPTLFVPQNKITTGTGTGQLVYNAMSGTGVTINSNQSQIKLSRTFSNGSSGAVTVNTIYLIVSNLTSGTKFLILAELLSPGDTINPSQTYGVDLFFTITT